MWRYRVEIHEEGHTSDPGATFYSDEPFLAIGPGDLIHPGSFGGWEGEREQDGKWMLEVTRVEHILMKSGNLKSGDEDSKHSLSVHTKYVPNTAATRGAR